MIHRSFRYRLYPTAAQENELRQVAGVTRLIYNLALEQREKFWRQYRAETGDSLTFVSQGREVTALRAEFDFIRAAPSNALIQALRDLDRAYAAFFSGRASYPTPRKRGVDDRFRIKAKECPTRALNKRWSVVRVPNVGHVRFRSTRPMEGRCLSGTFSLTAGQWFVSFTCEVEHDAPANDNPAVGIDRGIANTLALSTGEMFSLPSMATLERRKRRAQRVLARRKKGSNRRRRQLRRVACLSARIARVRSDWQHRVSLDIAGRFGAVAIEDLKIVNMSAKGRGKRGLNRAILNQAWAAFADKLAYKLGERGGVLITVPAAYSSQTCSACGAVDARSRKSQSAFACVECGFTDNADRNAAEVILRRSTAWQPVEGGGYAPVETGTCLEAA